MFHVHDHMRMRRYVCYCVKELARQCCMDSSTFSVSTTPGTSLSASATSGSRVRDSGASKQPAAASSTSITADDVSIKREAQSTLWGQEDDDIYVSD